ncbi:universal stress protein [Lactobacillus sp. S2-2]|uniref:universal stress protein n=1 Tax=Lactobacillus sp. S2-2 TaxID=2692917 RepID=UPI001F353F97|nr:universal stress protein [Lactobacillus sp. S2-2]MCF6515780.1 universal stress protein [Lactobacillus sp. S2-2]
MINNYQNILVPVDGSYESELAFQKAMSIAKANDSKIILVHALDIRAFQNITSFDNSVEEEMTTNSKKILEKYVDNAHKEGITKIEYLIEFGSPKTIIARDIPEKENIDLITIGATGLNAVERLLIGSLTEYVTKAAKCDVLVVRTDLNNKYVNNKKNR